jgi:hypothetical protein
MTAARRLLPICGALTLGACTSGPPPGTPVIVEPGLGKDFASFLQDDTICRRHAATNTGYGDFALRHTQGSANTETSGAAGRAGTAQLAGTTGGVSAEAGAGGTTGEIGVAAGAPAGSGTTVTNTSRASTPEPPDKTLPNQLGYIQCMAARGDTVRPGPSGYTEAANWYGYAYPYPYGYGYPYGFYDGGFIGVFGGGFHDRDFHRRFFHGGGSHDGGFHGGGGHH